MVRELILDDGGFLSDGPGMGHSLVFTIVKRGMSMTEDWDSRAPQFIHFASYTRHSPDNAVQPMRRDAGIEQRAQRHVWS